VDISLYAISVWVLPLLIAITFHEAAHAFVAYKLGDDTAWQLGRVSFNPLKHIDPFGTVILPGCCCCRIRRSCSATPSRSR
jgi:Zn-dependent protease